MNGSGTPQPCPGWLEKCDQLADPPYRFCKKHLERWQSDPWAPVLDAYAFALGTPARTSSEQK